MSEYFAELKSLGNVRFESDLSNYTTKTVLKNATGIDISPFAKKIDLGGLKSNVDKLDIDKLKNVPTNLKSKVDKLDVDKLIHVIIDLSKSSDVVKMMLLKKMYVKLRTKILNIKLPITHKITKYPTLLT